MRFIQEIIATTHVDLEKDRFMLSALEGMVDQINSNYVSMWFEHDPRIPPIGRLVSAKIEQLPDGEFVVKGIAEVFEPGDHIKFEDNGRRMPIGRAPMDGIQVIHDNRSWLDDDLPTAFKDLRDIAGVELGYYGKKGLETIQVLTISASFIAGSIAAGFLKKIGSDAWDSFKKRLSEAVLHKSAGPKGNDVLTVFQCIISGPDHEVSIETQILNPQSPDIDIFLENGTRALDESIGVYLDAAPNLIRLVLELKNGHLQVKFGVRSDGVPLYFKESGSRCISDIPLKR